MGKTCIYELKRLEHDILDAIKGSHENFISPVLMAEFKKAIENLPEKWEDIKDIYLKNIKYLVTSDEKMIYTILASKMGLDFLDKDSEYVEEFLSALSVLEISPLNYVCYAQIILNPPFYDIIVSIVKESGIFCYFEFSRIVINIVGSNPSSYEITYALKALHRIKGDTYTLLIDKKDNIYEIYTKLYKAMIDANKNVLLYNDADFKKLDTLVNIDFIDKSEIIKRILEIEYSSYSIKQVIQSTLELLDEYQKVIPITRRKKHGLH